MAEFSDYIIYADESGSPILTADEKDFPIFVLVFLIVEKAHYCDYLVPAFQRLKFDFVGHDQLILHERDIRRQSNQFAFLQVSKKIRECFSSRIGAIIEDASIQIVCAIIDKTKLKKSYNQPFSPYDLALTFCMEKAAKVLRKMGETDTQINVIFEARGANEDHHLELEFFRIANGAVNIGKPSKHVTNFEWKPHFIDKKSNSCGLQIADLAARPLGLGFLKPKQKNRALALLNKKTVFPHPKIFP